MIEQAIIKDEITISNLWSARKTLADQAPLNQSETVAIRELLDSLLGNSIPSTREVQRYFECKELISQCEEPNQTDYFIPTVNEFEKKYLKERMKN